MVKLIGDFIHTMTGLKSPARVLVPLKSDIGEDLPLRLFSRSTDGIVNDLNVAKCFDYGVGIRPTTAASGMVVDKSFKVLETKGLCIVNGSVIPTNPCVTSLPWQSVIRFACTSI